MKRRARGSATVKIVWDLEISENSELRDTQQLEEAARNAIKDALMNEAMASSVIITSLNFIIIGENKGAFS